MGREEPMDGGWRRTKEEVEPTEEEDEQRIDYVNAGTWLVNIRVLHGFIATWDFNKT